MSGWGSWGNWISSTVSSVVDTSSKIVSELTTTADEEVEQEKKGTQKQGLKLYRTDEEVEAEKQQKEQIQNTPAEESELERIFLSSASAVVDGTFKTFDTVFNEGAKIIKSVEGTNVTGIVENTSAKAKGVFQTAIQFLSLDELEEENSSSSSSSSKQPQTNNNNNNKNLPGGVGDEENDQPINQNTPEQQLPPSFQRHFEDYLGNIHLQALELLSMECMMKTHEFQRKGNKAIVSLFAAQIQNIKDKFEEEEEVDFDELLPSFSSFTFNSKVEAIRHAVDQQHATSTSTANKVITSFKEKITDFKSSSLSAATINKPTTKLSDDDGGETGSDNGSGGDAAAAAAATSDNGNDHNDDDGDDNIKDNKNDNANNNADDDKNTHRDDDHLSHPVEKLNTADFISSTSSEFLQLLHKECLLILAKHSSLSIELFNRIAENMLIEAKNSLQGEVTSPENAEPSSIPDTSADQTLLKLSYFKYLSNSLADDISKLSYPFVSASKSIAVILKEQFPEENVSSVEEHVKSSINNIYLDTGDANSTIFNSLSNVVPILQWIYVFSEAKLTGPE